MTQMASDERLILQEIEDHGICCDYAGSSFCPKGEAKWIGFASCKECPRSAKRLICDPCKDLLLETEDGLSCPACMAVMAPARLVFDRIEAL